MDILEVVNVIYIVSFFVIGTLFGSFFSLATYRLPRKQDIMVKRSYCPKCEHELSFFDLIPVLSYIIRGGKCKYCGDKISPRYICLELFNGIFFLANYLLLGMSYQLIFVLVVYIICFLFIGSAYMKNKMEFELNIVARDEMLANKKAKSGVFNIELLVAVFAFIIYYIATIYTNRNYKDTLNLVKCKSDAMNLCINAMEEAKAEDYDLIKDLPFTEIKVDDRSYVCSLTVEEYQKDNSDVDIYGYWEDVNYAKKLTSNVSYKYGNKDYTVKFDSVVYEE